MDILNSYIKLDVIDHRIKTYISNLISNSNVYTLDIDPVDNNDGYFGFSKFPDNTIKSCIFYESQIEGKTLIPTAYFIANLEENSFHSEDALYNLRKHIMIGKYTREQFDLERGNRIYHEPKEPDPEEFIEDEGYEVRVYVDHGYFSYKVPTLERAIEHGQTILKSKGFRAADGVDKNRLPLYSVNKVVIIGEGAGETKYPAIVHRI